MKPYEKSLKLFQTTMTIHKKNEERAQKQNWSFHFNMEGLSGLKLFDISLEGFSNDTKNKEGLFG